MKHQITQREFALIDGMGSVAQSIRESTDACFLQLVNLLELDDCPQRSEALAIVREYVAGSGTTEGLCEQLGIVVQQERAEGAE